LSKITCPWCGKKIPQKEFLDHVDKHKDIENDIRLLEKSEKYHQLPPPEISKDKIKFTQCLAAFLTPLANPGEYPKEYNENMLMSRIDYERKIYKVLTGKLSLREFFSEITRNWDMHSKELSKGFYNCLKNLKSPEAKQMKEMWFRYINQL
jgi:hypothetical protein